MNRETVAVIGVLASALAFLFTGHPVWFLVSAACGAYYGWQFGKRRFPAEDYA